MGRVWNEMGRQTGSQKHSPITADDPSDTGY